MQFHEYVKHFDSVPGWFEVDELALWDALLSAQSTLARTGHFLEIGTWKGRSAGMLALHSKPQESCIFVDVRSMSDAESIIKRAVPGAHCVYIQASSDLLMRLEPVVRRQGGFRWCHIDGGHSCESVINDMQVADSVLSQDGIVAVHDFFSAEYPQVTRAVFHFLSIQPCRLSLLLCGFNSAFLCRPTATELYFDFMRSHLLEELGRRGIDDVAIWKTAPFCGMGAFGISKGRLESGIRGFDWDEQYIPH